MGTLNEMGLDDINISSETEENELNKKNEINIGYSWPANDEYEYSAKLERINFDLEKQRDLAINEGFIISAPKATIKKDIKDPNGIFSPKFGQKLGDLNPFVDRYSCECGGLKGRINKGIICPNCHTECKFVDDDFKMFGWIELIDDYPIIHPDLYQNIDAFFGRSKFDKDSHNKIKGSKLKNIIRYDKEIDINGHEMEPKPKPDEPFYGIGMIEFHRRFDEIMKYYYKKNPKKIDLYNDIMEDKDKIFIHSIPVFTTNLRPMDISQGMMFFEKTTALYNMISKLSHDVNKVDTKSSRTPILKNMQLFKLQMKFLELYDEIVAILNGKRGQLRMLIGGRYNFSSRCVIRQDPSLRIDQVRLPYVCLVIVLKAQIENILHKTYNISFHEAYDIWSNAVETYNESIANIIMMIINSSKDDTGAPTGVPVLINRNPSIAYGCIMQSFCIGINRDYTMSTPLQILKPLAADYDGDVLNILFIINEAFFQRAYQVFNPRNAMYISRNDGMVNKGVLVQRDTLINANTLLNLTRYKHTKEEMAEMNEIKECIKAE